MSNTTAKVLGWPGLIFLVLVVAGVGGLLYWGWDLFVGQAEELLNANPVIQEHIGSIEELTIDFTATGEADGDDVFVFEVKGDKGSGVVTAEFVTIDENSEELRSGKLDLPSGETYDLLE